MRLGYYEKIFKIKLADFTNKCEFYEEKNEIDRQAFMMKFTGMM
jgi:hypothetical protein